MIPLTIIIPAYNEEKGIRATLEDVMSFCGPEGAGHQIILVDDASGDKTSAIAGEFDRVTILKNPVNIGYGGSIKRALLRATHEHVLIMDADGTYPAAEITKLVPHAEEFDMVVGKREGRYYHGSPVKRLSRLIFYVLLKYVTGESIPDANSGLRVFRKSIVTKFMGDLCSGFSFTTTITIMMLSNQYLIKFVPIEYKKRIGKSKVRFFRDSLRTLQLLVEAIAFYNPIKAFLPFSVVSFAAAAYFTAQYFFTGLTPYMICASIFSFSALLFFSFGVLGYIMTRSKK